MSENEKENDNKLAIWDEFKGNQRVLIRRLGAMMVNGKKLTDNEIAALAAYSMTNDLNPFNNECYYLPNMGPTPGIAGWRKKAQEQLDWEAQQAGELSAHYWIEYEKAEVGEAKFDPTKDFAWKVILRDWLSDKKWRRDVFEAMDKLILAKVDDPYHEALKLVGYKPEWTGVGVVTAGENFGGDKMDRNERAKKRAEKIAIRKRFPRIKLPDPEIDYDDVIDVTPEPVEHRTEKEILADLGIDQEEDDSPKQETLEELQNKVVEFCIKLGGAKNEALMEVLKKHNKSGNPTKIKDIKELNDLYTELNTVLPLKEEVEQSQETKVEELQKEKTEEPKIEEEIF
jgi:hypothetical protein